MMCGMWCGVKCPQKVSEAAFVSLRARAKSERARESSKQHESERLVAEWQVTKRMKVPVARFDFTSTKPLAGQLEASQKLRE